MCGLDTSLEPHGGRLRQGAPGFTPLLATQLLMIRADYPLDAFNHARSMQTTGTECSTLGGCERCWVETETIGTWEAINRRLGALKVNLRARAPINVSAGV